MIVQEMVLLLRTKENLYTELEDWLEKEGRPTAVDLIYDNRMMGSLTPNTTVKKTGKFKVSLGFSNAEMRKRALFNQVLNKPERPFFGFNDRTEKAIKKSFNRFVEKEIKRHLWV